MRLGPKKGGGRIGGFFCPCYIPHHSLLFPLPGCAPKLIPVSPQNLLRARAEARATGQLGWRSRVPGGPHGVGVGTRIPLVSVSAPGHRILVPPPGAPRAQRRLWTTGLFLPIFHSVPCIISWTDVPMQCSSVPPLTRPYMVVALLLFTR